MHRNHLALLAIIACLLCGSGYALDLDDLPIRLNFHLGTHVKVVPAKDDHSRQMGLVFIPESVKTDYTTSLAIKGLVVNNSSTPYNTVVVTLKVTSLKNNHIINGKIIIEPSTLAPGSARDFIYHMNMYGNHPRIVTYKITACPGSAP
ncbi:MAG: hypothetical protein LUD38_07535 [Parabacteroides sp.]|nr:hypothetical protein [Parabacteroides sp.]